MRRNKIQSRIEKRKQARRQNDADEKKITYKKICQKIFQTELYPADFDVMTHTMNVHSIFNKTLLASNIDQAKENLKNLALIMKKEDDKDKLHNKNIMNVIDPTLDYRFLNRQSLRDFNLPQIKTRLKWQKGEFPFFKTEARHYTKETVPYKNRRQLNRYIKSFVIQDVLTGAYHEIPFPTEDWPNKGTLFLTNHRIFFKRSSKKHCEIPFENIVSYHFYENGIYVEYMKSNEKIMEVFFVDPDKSRLLETMIKTTL